MTGRGGLGDAANIGIDFDHAVTPRLIGRNFPDCRALIVERHGDDYPVDALMQAWHAAYDAIVEREGIALYGGGQSELACGRVQNQLLAALPEAEWQRWQPHRLRSRP